MIPQLELNPSGYYKIQASGTLMHTFDVGRAAAWEFKVSHSTWANNQSHTMRFWVSESPGGSSVHGWPQGVWRFVTASRQAQKFIIYDSLQSGWKFDDVVFAWPVMRDRTYYLMIQNVENKVNGFGLDIRELYNDPPQ
jgi:hypothetical protein